MDGRRDGEQGVSVEGRGVTVTIIESSPVDEMPLCEEWFRQAGFTYSERDAAWIVRRGRVSVWIRLSGQWGAWIEATMGGGFSGYRKLKTCGEARIACFLIGVEIVATTTPVSPPPPTECDVAELLRQNMVMRDLLREIAQKWGKVSRLKEEKRFQVMVHRSEDQQLLDWKIAEVEDVLASVGDTPDA